MGRPITSSARLLGIALLVACKKEEPPAGYPPYATQPNVVYPQSTAPAATSVPTAAPAAVPGPAAMGLPCNSEQDLQCAFAHCVNQRCGGCRSSADCKANAQCLPSVFGYACFPGAAQASPPAPAPVPVPAPSSPANPADPLDALRARCVQRTNEFRARLSLAALGRQADREACLDTQAQADGASGTAHGAFGRCQEGAQNECPGWPGPLDQVIDKCLAQMFAEGPGPFAGHGHYLNMTNPQFRTVTCGFSTTANGQIWLVQDFYR